MVTRVHLEEALDEAENIEAKFHLRQALQLQLIEEEHAQLTDHRQFADADRQ